MKYSAACLITFTLSYGTLWSAATINVSSAADLANAINTINSTGDNYTVNIQNDITLTGFLPPIYAAGTSSSVTIQTTPSLTSTSTIDGNGYPVFQVIGGGNSPTAPTITSIPITIQNLNLTGAIAHGGSSGLGGGAGAGVGGALFIYQPATSSDNNAKTYSTDRSYACIYSPSYPSDNGCRNGNSIVSNPINHCG